MSVAKKTRASKVCVGTVITSVEYESLEKMLASRDEGNHLVARKLLEGCDVQKSIYWIWKLAGDHSYKMLYLRTKASREFDAECDGVYKLGWMDEEELAENLHARGWLTEEIFGYLKKGILDDISERARNSFFNITAEVGESKKKYDPKDTPKLIYKIKG